jgi:hypothetical protein
MIPDPAPDDDTLPTLIPLDHLTDEALDAARLGDWLRVGLDGTPYLTADALEHVVADVLLASREEASRG